MAASSMIALSPAHHGGAGSPSGVGGSVSRTDAGVAAPAFGLLPVADMHKLRRLMSDENEQLIELGGTFSQSAQLRSGHFWHLAADCLGQPLEAVLLTGMFIRSEADKEWETLQQQTHADAVPQPDEAFAAEDEAAAAMLGLPLPREQPQPALTQQGPQPEQQSAEEQPVQLDEQHVHQRKASAEEEQQQHEAAASVQSATPAARAEAPAEAPSTSASALTAAVAVATQPDAAAEEEAAALLAGLAEAADTEQHGAQPAAEATEAAALLQGFAEAAAAERAAPPPLNLLDLPGDVLMRIFSFVPISDRLTLLRCVNRRCCSLVDQLGLSGGCLCFDVSVLQKDRTSQYLEDVGELLARALPEHQRLSVLIQRLPSPRSSLRLVQELDSDAQLRLVVRQPVQDMRHRLRRLTALPMRKLALVDTERLPSHLPHLTRLESLSWEGEGPFEDPDMVGEWGRALARLPQLTYLRWQPRPPPLGAPAKRMEKWNELSASPAALAGMARLHTLVWLPPRAAEALPDGAYLYSLCRLALPAQLAERSLPLLGQAAELRTLCLTGWEAAHRVQRIAAVVGKLPKLERFAYSCAPAAEAAAAAVAAAVASLRQSRPELRIEDSTAACLAELRDKN